MLCVSLQPHAIITAVGTKAFLWDVATEAWVPDPGYSLLLDEGWDAEKVSVCIDRELTRASRHARTRGCAQDRL